jgi:hypothetical protein
MSGIIYLYIVGYRWAIDLSTQQSVLILLTVFRCHVTFPILARVVVR